MISGTIEETPPLITQEKNYQQTRTLTKPNTEIILRNKIPLPVSTAPNDYHTFQIPKRTGGMRTITAPEPELKAAQTEMLKTLYKIQPAMHNSAYAYIPQRSCYNALQRHQENNSKWFLKIDLKDFFPSCTKTFVKEQLKNLYPFCLYSPAELKPLFDLCFYKNALPQGAPTSPYLSNLVMIPIDYAINHTLYNYNRHHFVYTRYADDLLISCNEKFDKDEILQVLHDIFKETPFKINTEKTRFGSISGRNWNLGLMLNKDNNITVGYRRKKYLKNNLHNFKRDLGARLIWPLESLYTLQGELAYIKNTEPYYVTQNILPKYPNIEQQIIDSIKLYTKPLANIDELPIF